MAEARVIGHGHRTLTLSLRRPPIFLLHPSGGFGTLVRPVAVTQVTSPGASAAGRTD